MPNGKRFLRSWPSQRAWPDQYNAQKDPESILVLPIQMGAQVVDGNHLLGPVLCTISHHGAKRLEP